MNYRSEIDGLRTIAILPVILYHLAPNLIPYGYLGVDIFFVISGFLISTIISDKIKSNSFSILEFYERRVKRIAPLYFLIIIISVPLAYLILYPHQLTDFSQSIVASLSFLSNFFFYYEIDYFNPFINYSPLIHTWSLSVEEQFYLLLPLCLIVFQKLRNNVKVIIFLFFSILSFFYCIQLSESNISLGFYSSISRAWELLAGVVLSLVNISFFKNFKERYIRVISLLCLIFLVSIFFGIIKFKHPGFLTIIPVLLTVLIIQLSSENNFLKKLLSFKPMVHIGLLSYSLYMIHQPVFSFYKVYKLNNGLDSSLNIFEGFIIILVIYFLSYFSYKFYEKPIRYSKLKRKNVFLYFLSFSLFFMSIGYYGHYSRGLKDNFLVKNSEYINFDRDVIINDVMQIKGFVNETSINKNDNYILIIGDSMAHDLFSALNYFDQSNSVNYKILRLDDNCLKNAINALKSNENIIFECEGYSMKSNMMNELIKNSSKIILSSLWTESSYNFGVEYALKINQLYDKKVVVFGPAQFSDIITISIQASKNKISRNAKGQFIFDSHIRIDKMKTNQNMKFHQIILNNDDIEYVDKYEFFCKDNSCELFYEDGYPIIWDDAHLSKRGLKDFGKFVYNSIYN